MPVLEIVSRAQRKNVVGKQKSGPGALMAAFIAAVVAGTLGFIAGYHSRPWLDRDYVTHFYDPETGMEYFMCKGRWMVLNEPTSLPSLWSNQE